MEIRYSNQWGFRRKGRVYCKIGFVILFLFFLSSVKSVAADLDETHDIITLKDKSVLTGHIIRLTPDFVLFNTSYGELKLEKGEIKDIKIYTPEQSNDFKTFVESDNEGVFSERFGKSRKKVIIENNKDISDIQKRVLDSAFHLLDKKPNETVFIKNKKFKLDCVGTVSAIFYRVGIDITKDFHKYEGNGVARIYYSLRDNDSLHKSKMPEVGDIIFWDNTWDKNNDGKFGNDPFTHTGIVLNVDDDGTIHYIHENYYSGVVVEYMNLYQPTVYKDVTGKILNSPMYIGSSWRSHPDHSWLSGDLWSQFGGVLKVMGEYK